MREFCCPSVYWPIAAVISFTPQIRSGAIFPYSALWRIPLLQPYLDHLLLIVICADASVDLEADFLATAFRHVNKI